MIEGLLCMVFFVGGFMVARDIGRSTQSKLMHQWLALLEPDDQESLLNLMQKASRKAIVLGVKSGKLGL